MCESPILEINNEIISDSEEGEEEEESLLCYQEVVSDDIPPSLLSYFESSKSRAAVCEKLILEEFEDNSEDEGTTTLTEQGYYATETKNNKAADCRIHAMTDIQETFSTLESAYDNSEDESASDEYVDEEKYLELKISKFEEKKKREKKQQEENQKSEQRRERELHFQEELKKIMEAEKLHQLELEERRKRSQENLEKELLVRQERISDLQKQVQHERRMIEEEQRRKKEEMKEKRKREEQERRKMEEDGKRKITQMRLEEEEVKRKKEEEERIKMEEEEERKIVELRREEEEDKIKKEEEQRKKKDEDEQWKMVEVRRKEEDKRMKEEDERRKNEEDKKKKMVELRWEEENNKKKQEEDRRKKDEEMRQVVEMRCEEEEREKKEAEENRIKEEKEKRKIVEMRLKEEEDKIKKKDEERRKKKEGEKGKLVEMKLPEVEEHIKSKEHERRKEEENKKNVEISLEEEERMRKVEEEEGKMLDLKEEEGRREIEEGRKENEEEETRKLQENEVKLEEEMEPRRKEEEEVEEERRGRVDQDKTRKRMAGEKKMEDKKSQSDEETNLNDELRRMEEGEEEKKKEEKVYKKGRMTEREREEEARKREDLKKSGVERKVRDAEDEGSEEQVKKKYEAEQEKNKIQRDVQKSEIVKQHDGDERKMEDERKTDEKKQQEEGMEKHEEKDCMRRNGIIREGKLLKEEEKIDGRDVGPSRPAECQVCHTDPLSPSVEPPDQSQQRRLQWMKECVPWSKLSLHSRRTQRGGPAASRRGVRKTAEVNALPPICPYTLLQSTAWRSLQEVTTVTLEDLPGCSLSTLVQCPQLRSLTLRRCGLRALEGLSQLTKLCYIDLEENHISYVDCENMTSLQVLRLARNKLTSIHGLSGAENLDVLELSYNSITRIAGLDSMKKLQKLSVDHNQLISTKGLRDVYTLLHLDCSHNHLGSLEGLDDCALLHTLDLRANSLTEPPRLSNQVLLRQLRLDDNSISSLQSLTACWLPLMQHLSVAQNRFTVLPSMSDFVSLESLDLKLNCLSELKNVCRSLEGCQFLRHVDLTGNPLQQERDWRSTLLKWVPGLREVDGQQTDSFHSPPTVQQLSSASGCFSTFCQTQLQQTRDLQRRHSRELSTASSHLDKVKTLCRHFISYLRLAEDQRFAHEYGDTATLDHIMAEEHTNYPEEEKSANELPAVITRRDDVRRNSLSLESQGGPFESFIDDPKTQFSGKKEITTSSTLEKVQYFNNQNLDLKNSAAVVIQQHWRKYRQKSGKANSCAIQAKGGERGGDGGEPYSGLSFTRTSVVGKDNAATVIQAFWRGFALRRRLASALAAVTCPDAAEDDTFEEVDVDEFVFDEVSLEKQWTVMLPEDSASKCSPLSEHLLPPKSTDRFLDPPPKTPPPPLVQRLKQAWVARDDPATQKSSPEGSNRSKSPASSAVLSGLSKRSEQIVEEWGFTDNHTALLMLKRAHKMKAKSQPQNKQRDPSVRQALFRNCNYQPDSGEARTRPAPRNRSYVKGSRPHIQGARHSRSSSSQKEGLQQHPSPKIGKVVLGLQEAETTQQWKQERAEQCLHTQAAQSDGLPESVHFLPEINSSILKGGRVQLVADPTYADRLHHARGLWANSSLTFQPCPVSSYPGRNSPGHASATSPKRVSSAPSEKEHILLQDNPVQPFGWGRGKKRDRVHK